MVQVVLYFPDENLLDRYPSPEVFGEKIRLTAALTWYQQGDIALEEAAHVAGLNRWDFLKAVGEHNPESVGTSQLFAPLRGKVKYYEDLTTPTTEEWGEV